MVKKIGDANVKEVGPQIYYIWIGADLSYCMNLYLDWMVVVLGLKSDSIQRGRFFLNIKSVIYFVTQKTKTAV